jgi:hypothetical protein
MAKFELKFLDLVYEEDFINVVYENQIINKKNDTLDVICIRGEENKKPFEILLDKSTAIKFAKTLRTEINKITEGEENGDR